MAGKLILLFCFLLFPFILFSQPQNIKFERISADDGASLGFVHDIIQDQQGFMWFATEMGLYKYDGYKFITYRYNSDDSTSLSSNVVRVIHEDRSGTIWVGTVGGGLNKYDREKDSFVHYTYDKNNKTSLGGYDVEDLDDFQYGKKHILWIGTGTGLNKMDLETEEITRYPHTKRGHPYRYVEALIVDKTGQVWVGSTEDGLHKFNPETEQYSHYRNDSNNPTSLSNNNVLSLFEDQRGQLWIGTLGGGLNKFLPETEEFKIYRHDPNNSMSLNDDVVVSIYEDKKGIFWVGTGEGGLNVFDRNNERFRHYRHNPDDPSSIIDNSIMCIYEDKSGVFWIGTWGGLNKFDPQKNQFSQISHVSGDPNSLTNNYITSIFESYYKENAILWIGTKNGGLNRLNRKTGQITHYQHEPGNPNSLNNNFVNSIYEDRSGNLWIGNFVGGLHKFNPRTGLFKRYLNNPDDPNSIRCNSILSIIEDKTGRLWIGTQTGGVNKFDPHPEKFSPISRRRLISQIYQDRSGILWFASMGGLVKYDPETEKITTYRQNPDNPHSISNNQIYSICESVTGDIWVGTAGGGLNQFDRNTEKFTRYTVEDGLASNFIFGILEDEQNNLWLSTNNGLSKFNTETKEIRNYNRHDGLISDQFSEGAYYKSKKGEMFFGALDGLITFYPNQIMDNPELPPVYITDFHVFNKPVPIKSDMRENSDIYTLPQNITTLSEIELSYEENVFSFEFSALDYHSPQKNQYAYKMEGVDPDWVLTDATRRFATYTNLDPGDYLFKVKGSNNNGFWNEEGTSITIIVTPPWWQSNHAYAAYIVLFGLIIFGVWRFQLSRIRMKHQMEIDHIHTEKLEEVDRLKSRFFANISHEFRTPLTLIKGPVEQLLSGNFKEKTKKQFRMILRNTNRLLGLINQLLDLSKFESGKMALHVVKTNLVEFIKGLAYSFSSLAESKKITLQIDIEEDDITGYIDRDKMEKIITNLLSNAFKFTPECGEIGIHIGRGEAFSGNNLSSIKTGAWNASPQQSQIPNPIPKILKITITNTGSGIPKEKLDHIFDRFYKAETTYKKDGEGTGIGLALTKELVELHRGQIDVSCTGNKSDTKTMFTVNLPISKNYFEPKELETGDRRPQAGKQPEFRALDSTSTHPEKSESPLRFDRSPASGLQPPLVLVVEDNPDVTTHICSFLDHEYRIITAVNGKDGSEKALKEFPDLIISDVMMPEMDGFELCHHLKSDEKTSHIPIILLTAKADLDSKIEGLEFGADDYISKPFEAKELQVRIKNLIDQRQKLREIFSQTIEINPGEIATCSMDEQFIKRLLDVFENHVAESDFSTEDFAREVGMSRSNLHRKLQALTNQPTHEFLRTLRLKRAAEMIKKSTGTVTEIAYAVGFNNPSYFSKMFRQQFGQTPSQFASKYQ